jgi:hypothetical protein
MRLMTISFFAFVLAGDPIAFVLGMATVPYLLIQGNLERTIIPQQQFAGLTGMAMSDAAAVGQLLM